MSKDSKRWTAKVHLQWQMGDTLQARPMHPPGAEALAGSATKGAVHLVSWTRLLILPEVVRHVHHAPPRLHTFVLRQHIQHVCPFPCFSIYPNAHSTAIQQQIQHFQLAHTCRYHWTVQEACRGSHQQKHTVNRLRVNVDRDWNGSRPVILWQTKTGTSERLIVHAPLRG